MCVARSRSSDLCVTLPSPQPATLCCVGQYSKAQGKPVRVWGMLACGGIHIHVLPEGETLDSILYADIIEDFYDDWAGNCEHLVC